MKHDIILDRLDNLDDFRQLFLANIGTQQVTYDCYIDMVIVRITTSSLDGNQLISIGLFDLVTEPTTINKVQFDPTRDVRFGRADIVHKIWLQNYSGSWGQMTLASGQENEALDSLCDLLRTVHKYQKLKAFI